MLRLILLLPKPVGGYLIPGKLYVLFCFAVAAVTNKATDQPPPSIYFLHGGEWWPSEAASVDDGALIPTSFSLLLFRYNTLCWVDEQQLILMELGTYIGGVKVLKNLLKEIKVTILCEIMTIILSQADFTIRQC